LTRKSDKAEQLSTEGFHPILADLGAGELPQLPQIDTVLWSVGFDRTPGVSRETIWIDGLQTLLTNLPATVQRFLYVSSTGVYSQSDGSDVSESDPAEPNTDSGRCCLQAERIVLRHGAKFGFRPTIFRMAGLYGPDRLLRRAADLREGTALSGSPDNFLNLIHIDDAVTAVRRLAGSSDVSLINVVNSGTLTRSEYYAALAQLVDAPAPQFDETKATTRGNNKRVISEVATTAGLEYRYDNVRNGLHHSVTHSSDLGTASTDL